MISQRTAKQLYQDVIAQCEEVSGDLDTDKATRDEVNRQITALRTKMQDAAFDSITSRTNDLQELVLNLQSVVAKAQSGGVGDKVKGLTALVTEARSIIDSFNATGR